MTEFIKSAGWVGLLGLFGLVVKLQSQAINHKVEPGVVHLTVTSCAYKSMCPLTVLKHWTCCTVEAKHTVHAN